jgi:hypothetical protein
MDVRMYRLFVKIADKWVLVCDIEAESHKEALRQAIARLSPEHYDKPIRVEQIEE